MPFSTRPYAPLKFLFGTSYSVDETSVREQNLFSQEAVLPRPATAQRSDGEGVGSLRRAFRRVFNVGDVVVSSGNTTHVFKSVLGVNAFIAAVEGKHPDVQPQHPPIASFQSAPSWHKGFTDKDLEKFLLMIPAISDEIYNSALFEMSKKRGVSPALIWNVKPGDWVKQGEIIAHYDVRDIGNVPHRGSSVYKAIIKAPCDGKLEWINEGKLATSWNTGEGKKKNGNLELGYEAGFSEDDMLFSIRPTFKRTPETPSSLELLSFTRTYEQLRDYVEFSNKASFGSFSIFSSGPSCAFIKHLKDSAPKPKTDNGPKRLFDLD